MKKVIIIILFLISILISGILVYGQQGKNVTVRAIVGSVNKTPIFGSFNVADSFTIKKGTSKIISFTASDPENQNILISISADYGTVNPVSSTIAGSGGINFVYYAPTSIVGSYMYDYIHIVINDTINYTTKNLRATVY